MDRIKPASPRPRSSKKEDPKQNSVPPAKPDEDMNVQSNVAKANTTEGSGKEGKKEGAPQLESKKSERRKKDVEGEGQPKAAGETEGESKAEVPKAEQPVKGKVARRQSSNLHSNPPDIANIENETELKHKASIKFPNLREGFDY